MSSPPYLSVIERYELAEREKVACSHHDFWAQVAIVALLLAYQNDVGDDALSVEDVISNLGLDPQHNFL